MAILVNVLNVLHYDITILVMAILIMTLLIMALLIMTTYNDFTYNDFTYNDFVHDNTYNDFLNLKCLRSKTFETPCLTFWKVFMLFFN